MPSPVRILRIITRLNIGGPAIQALTLSARLRSEGFDTLLLHGQPDANEGDMRAVLDPGPLSSHYISSLRRSPHPLHDARALSAVYRELCRFGPAIVHTHTAKAGTIGRLATLAYNRTHGRRQPARTIHTYHGHVFEGYFKPVVSAAVVAIERQLARATDVIVAISPRIREEIVSEYRIGRPDQVRVIPLGFDLDRFAAIEASTRASARAALQVPIDAPVVTTVGRLVPIKQQHLFLMMAARLRGAWPDAIFLIVGDGALREGLERQACHLGLSDHVRFLGWRGDLSRVYAATDVFALTSANEGTPVALIEAAASGLPSVSTNVGGVSDVITDRESGITVPAGDVEALADAVSALLASETRRQAMGAEGRRSAVARFGFQRLVRDLAQLYRELL